MDKRVRKPTLRELGALKTFLRKHGRRHSHFYIDIEEAFIAVFPNYAYEDGDRDTRLMVVICPFEESNAVDDVQTFFWIDNELRWVKILSDSPGLALQRYRESKRQLR